jgi:AcrR family transcriptional regulator
MAVAKASQHKPPAAPSVPSHSVGERGVRQNPSPSGGGQGGGLRARKKQKTRESIQRTALRLFQKQGYEETTIEQIAAAAEISPSTFFNYFPTKEDVVLFDAYDPIAIQMFLEAPKDEPVNLVVRRVLKDLAEVFQRDEDMILARGRLFLEVPELRARMWEETERTQVLINQILAERTGRRPDDFELRVTARVMMAAMMEATFEWMRSNGRRPLVELANDALNVLDAGAQLSRRARPRPRKRR